MRPPPPAAAAAPAPAAWRTSLPSGRRARPPARPPASRRAGHWCQARLQQARLVQALRAAQQRQRQRGRRLWQQRRCGGSTGRTQWLIQVGCRHLRLWACVQSMRACSLGAWGCLPRFLPPATAQLNMRVLPFLLATHSFCRRPTRGSRHGASAPLRPHPRLPGPPTAVCRVLHCQPAAAGECP